MCYGDGMETLQVFTRNEVADRLKVSLSTVGMLIKSNQIYSVKVGNTYRVPDWALEDYINGRPSRRPADPLVQDDGELFTTPSMLDGAE